MKRIDQVKGTFDQDREKARSIPSDATVKRLPRYYRYLSRLLAEGTLRISSSALSAKMGVTASQIRQDLACFGDFGQQGYGYNVRYLHSKISRILGLSDGHRAVFIGAGSIARTLLESPVFCRGDIRCVGIFDRQADPERGVLPLDTLPESLAALRATLAVMTLPPRDAEAVMPHLAAAGIRGVLNYSGGQLTEREHMIVQNVYPDDPCLMLAYRVGAMGEKEE